ncbi:alpha/beta-hydrolase [Choiromyces venosus 120613-1]|uniref:Alpha/beta-hydrolase n=1 Tax=Choiromyces venosus 120613-1 TaxID=1336337 RepID=A0A3N4KDZ4_9PEZI|nr:alpha/beta-hydrolase [Choiromyces venosus 120613-1]
MSPFNTFTVASAATPTIVGTALSHFLDNKHLENTPKASLSYHEGVELVRKFLLYASQHTVEQLQAFTAQYVPHPIWVHTEDESIPTEFLEKSAAHVVEQLGADGVERVGGREWWKWAPKKLTAEWIEMRKDWWTRTRHPEILPRTMFYVHGGGYFFGSVDEHRYQLQRHARKLKARVFAPRYRLAPQFPFPCAIYDVLACYLYLISTQSPETVILAGDSAGGGLILSLLVILRDQGLPMPAGAVLISPWVDLCHSFPSIVAGNEYDFMPPHGFFHKPSQAWPPPTEEDTEASITSEKPPIPSVHKKTVTIDGNLMTLKDQIHMYTTNDLIDHPLVSPVLQSTLGGLPPLLIIAGGGEILRDEQIYIAHKTANPDKYPTWPGHLIKDPSGRQQAALAKNYPPTKVWLQVYDGCCHVTPTLSFTRPAKLMFRAIAHFSAWALSNATNTSIKVDEDDDISVISTDDDNTNIPLPNAPQGHKLRQTGTIKGSNSMNVPAFDPENNMVRQQIDHQGRIFELPSVDELPGMSLLPEQIGVVKPEPVRRWLEAKKKCDAKFAKARREVERKRGKGQAVELAAASAAAGGGIGKSSLGLRFWSLMGYSHDEKTMAREEKAEAKAEVADRSSSAVCK